MSAFSSLTNRIFFATALLAVVSIAVAVYRVNVTVTAQAEQELRRGLEEAATLVENYRTTRLDHFTREARLVADLPKLKAAVATDHAPTVEPVAADYQRQLGADLFVVSAGDGAVLSAGGAPSRGEGVPPRGMSDAARGRESVSLWPTGDGMLEVVSVPIWEPGQPAVLGTLTVGFALDNAAAARLKSLTASEIAFTNDGRVLAATLPKDLWPEVAGLAAEAVTAGRAGSGPVRRVLGQEDYVAIRRPLQAGAAAGTAAGGGPAVVVLRSRTERLRVLSQVHAALAATAVIAVLAAIGLSYALARTVTRPLGVITRAMRDLASSGDLTRRIPEPPSTRWDDEDAKLLARTYNAMTESIGRFQREAAQRERLSSLGRLSTVIAHEVRNPLMIIKTAIRPLRRGSVPAEQLQRIAGDVEEEIGRLNRIVTEVLDFARPIRFELAPADLNEICREAAHAVWTGAPGAPRLALDPAIGVAVTDAERLRQALVNVLSNAREAVDARGADGEVRLRTERSGAVARISISDNGAGIEPDALPRIFEPFFTTRRTGSGIGLAIARNIIEGLGGTIAVAESGARGTTFAIELPLAPGAEARLAGA